MNNLLIKKFYEQIINIINSCGLPAGTAYYILKDILNEIEKIYNDCINRELQENNDIKKTQTVEISKSKLDKEETENEYTNTKSSEYSGGTSNN